ncbi:MAG: SLC13 family permease [Caldisericia bacterium]|nr:SLC13 family permease [Caldisericia bacterium]
MKNEIISILIFILSYLLIIFDILPRTIIVFFSASILVLLKILTPNEALSFVNWDAITLLFGMFTLVITLKEVNFFKIVGNRVVRIFGKNLILLFISLSLLTAFLSAFMDSITVMMFISSLTIEISKILGFNPVPFILIEIVSSNIGGSSTMVGDPPNVIIGTSLGFSFIDFLKNVAPISIIVLIFNIIYFLFIFKNDLKIKIKKEVEIKRIEIKDKYSFFVSIFVFLLTVSLLVFHKTINISVGVIGLIGASLALFLNGNRFRNIWEKIDWDTLLFFIGLFIIVGSLEKVGFLSQITNFMIKIFKNPKILPSELLFFSGILSSVVDNVPLAFSMVPIIKNMSVLKGIPIGVLAWGLSLGTDLGGNGTPIGASANVVALSILEKSGIRVSWGYYLKKVFLGTILSLILSGLLLILFHRF